MQNNFKKNVSIMTSGYRRMTCSTNGITISYYDITRNRIIFPIIQSSIIISQMMSGTKTHNLLELFWSLVQIEVYIVDGESPIHNAS